MGLSLSSNGEFNNLPPFRSFAFARQQLLKDFFTDCQTELITATKGILAKPTFSLPTFEDREKMILPVSNIRI